MELFYSVKTHNVIQYNHPCTRLLIALCLTACGIKGASAQNKPAAGTLPAATPATLPVPYTNTTINYIRSWEPNGPILDPAAVTAASVDVVKQSTQYFDGLGRPLQTVSKGQSPLKNDLVAPVVYDAMGREQYKYLPYVPQGSNDGKFKADPFAAQVNFYKNPAINPGVGGQTIYYDETTYEASPLNRVIKTYAPGNIWAKEGGNRPVEMQYLVNKISDSVRIWDVPVTSSIIPTSGTGRVYGVGQLYKSVVKNERGMRTVEFKDKEDHIILKKTELIAGSGDGYGGWLSTFYIYDDLGELRCVIPPKAVEIIRAKNWVMDAATANELCFFYRYDERDRMIMKKLPGADSTEIVYDLSDKPVFTRDGNLRNASQPGGAKWLATFYDGLNRPVMTALYNVGTARSTLQVSMNAAAPAIQTITHNIPAVGYLEVAQHDGRPRYVARDSIIFEPGFDTGTGSEALAETGPTANQDTFIVVVSNTLPAIPASALMPLTYTYYDDYSFTGAQPALTGDFGKPVAINDATNGGVTPYQDTIKGISNMTQGLVTGSKVRVLGTDQWLTTTTYYNDKGRAIQVITDNISGTQDVNTTLYDFNGKVLSTYLRHKNLRSGTVPEVRVLTMNSYDRGGRLMSIKKRLNDAAATSDQTISVNTYNELAQLKTKRLGVTADGQLEMLAYEYNIRNWSKGFNKAFVNGASGSWFGEQLSYDSGFVVNQYNGNIAGIKWKSGSNNISRAYGYRYDSTDRLTVADYSQQNAPNSAPTAAWMQDQVDYTVNNISYDANGNISTMTQKGMIGTTRATIDQLSYSYQASSNKLIAVADPSSTATAKLGDFINGANTGNDYAYDPNGNLTVDSNRNISAITYNHLNLPENITVIGKGIIKYLYDATGRKLRKIVTDNTSSQSRTVTTDYINGIVYRNDTLELIAHEEGRIRPVFNATDPVTYYYDYFIKDHLDNTRVVLTDQSDLSVYTATMETAQAAKETALFSNLEESRAAKPAGYPQDQTTAQNDFVAKINAKDARKKIGPSLVIRVMAGDTIQIGAKAFYKSIGPTDNKPATPEDMVAALVNAFGGAAAGNAAHGVQQAESRLPFGNFTSNDYQRLKEKDANQNLQDKPKAYLNFALFDDQFNLVDDNSGVRQVKGEPDQLQSLGVDKMVMKNTGFLYVYTSNETNQDVFFDNVTIAVASGPLLEETHYYPFGLTMTGISANALKGTGYPENRRKYNGIEFTADLDLDIYDAQFRNLDPQIGRWNQIDPKMEKMEMWSPYASNYDNPILYNDFFGDEPEMDGGPGPSFIPSPSADFVNSMNENLKSLGNNIGVFFR